MITSPIGVFSKRWNHILLYALFLTGTNEFGKANNIVSIYKGYEEVLQISRWPCIQGDSINLAKTERSKFLNDNLPCVFHGMVLSVEFIENFG